MKLDDLKGKEFGKLKVLERGEDYITPKGAHKTQWWCICSCGRTPKFLVTATHLKSGHTTRCLKCAKESGAKTNTNLNEYDLSGDFGVGWTSNTHKKFYFDLEDYDRIKNYGWREKCFGKNSKGEDKVYVSTSSRILLHRLIINAPKGSPVDHKNHNVFDCRKANLRICTNQQNVFNRTPKNGKIAGVRKTPSGKWVAEIQHNRIKYYLGTFSTEEDAIQARLEKEKELFREFSYNESIKDGLI